MIAQLQLDGGPAPTTTAPATATPAAPVAATATTAPAKH
jgi:hypothetical protein